MDQDTGKMKQYYHALALVTNGGTHRQSEKSRDYGKGCATSLRSTIVT